MNADARLADRTTRTTLLIVGMCGYQCREQMIAALERVKGVMEVEVNLWRARAVVVHDGSCTQKDLIDAVTRAGCRVAGA
jgi:copper chaperone CopZ